MYKVFIRIITAILFSIMSVNSLQYGITVEDVQNLLDKPLFVISPSAPLRVERRAQEAFAEIGLVYGVQHSDELLLRMGTGYTFYNSNKKCWGNTFVFPIWLESEIVSAIVVSVDTGKWKQEVQGLMLNKARVATGKENPLVFFRMNDTLDDEALEGMWVYGTDYIFQSSGYANDCKYEISDAYLKEFTSMRQDIKRMTESKSIPTLELNGLSASSKKIISGLLTSEEIPPALIKNATSIFSRYLEASESLDFCRVASWQDYDSDIEGSMPEYVVDQTVVEQLALQGGFKQLPAKKQIYCSYRATKRMRISGFIDPCILEFEILVDETGKIVSAWTKVATYKLGKSNAALLDTLQHPFHSVAHSESGNSLAEIQTFPVSTSREKLIGSIREKYLKNGYQKIADGKKTAYAIHELGGVKTDNSIQMFVSEYFENFGWHINEADEVVMVLDDKLTHMEAKQAYLASFNGGTLKSISYGDNILSMEARYLTKRTPLTEVFPKGIVVEKNATYFSALGPIRDFYSFYCEKEFSLDLGGKVFWIDLFYSIGNNERCAWLMVTPSVPRKETKVFERFFYPVTAKSDQIKSDMQEYYRKNQ